MVNDESFEWPDVESWLLVIFNVELTCLSQDHSVFVLLQYSDVLVLVDEVEAILGLDSSEALDLSEPLLENCLVIHKVVLS